MTTRTKILLLVVAIIIVAYPAMTWLTGIGVEAQLQRNEQRLLDENNYLVLVGREYHRGVYGATEILTYRIGGPFLRLNNNPTAQTLNSLRLMVRNRIAHGPVPGLRVFGLASVDSQLQLTTQAGGPASAVLSGKPFAQIHTVIGWLGGGRATVQSPAFQYRAADGTLFNWQGISGQLAYSRNLDTWSGAFQAPSLQVQDAKGRLEVAGLGFAAHKHRAFDAFYVGDSQFKLARIEFHPASGNPVLVQGISVQGTEGISATDAQYVEATGNLAMDSIQTTPFTATRVGYDFGFSHVHGPSLAALALALRDAQRDATSINDQSGRLLDIVRQYGPNLMLHDPVFTISRIGFFMPEGELRLSGKITVSGLKPEDLQGPAAIAMLAQHAQAIFDLRADTALVAKLLGTSAQTATFATQLQQFENLGYLKRDGSAYTTHIEYQAGKITINGAPYPSVPAAATP